jgi:hypothetical protein
MSQYDFGTIDPNTKSGTALATDLNSWRNALHSTHGGSSAPSYITAGMLWADTTSANYELKMYDGAQSITVAVIDATNNVARVAVDSAETSYITSTTAGQIQHIISGSAMVTVNSTGVGIGTSSPATILDVSGVSPTLTLKDSRTSETWSAGVQLGKIDFYTSDVTGIGAHSVASIEVVAGGSNTASPDGQLVFSTGIYNAAATERARIDSSGNLLVGKTTAGTSVGAGVEASANGSLFATRDLPTAASDSVVFFNRETSTGDIIRLRKDGTTVGYIGVGSSIYIGSGDTTITFAPSGDAIVPTGTDGATRSGAIDLGNSGNRWDTVFATVGTINTSDRTEKQDIEELNDAERRVAVACKGLLRKYRLKSAIAKKGEDARIHFGIIAQDLQAAFEAESLDAGRYGMFINSTWTDEETGEEKSLMGVRYSELLAFIIAAM